MIQNIGLVQGMDICLSATWLNHCSASCTRIKENKKAKVDTSNDSLKNCVISCWRNEPKVLRIPTSLALSLGAGSAQVHKINTGQQQNKCADDTKHPYKFDISTHDHSVFKLRIQVPFGHWV